MRKQLSNLCVILVLIVFPFQLVRAGQAAQPQSAPLAATDAYALIDEVNAFRAANGLAAYSINPILMTIAQQHAEYMSVNGVSHLSAGGARPYQRALNAGYPLAGDLSLGGFMSENINAGVNKTVREAVLEWQGDAPHLNTMLSPNLTEIGAGVAIVGDYIYYVIDCAHPIGSSIPASPASGSTLPAGTPEPTRTETPAVSTLVPSTPDTNGKVYHAVQKGETLWLIAVSYGVKVADLRRLNGLAETADIYPNMKLLILELPTPTPSNTLTATALPTFTLIPTWTPDAPPVNATPSPTPVKIAALDATTSLPILGIIIVAALVLAGVLAASTRVRR